MPVHARAFGTTYGDLAGQWWSWALNIPPEINPVLDVSGEFCDVDQSGKVWFLAGTFGGHADRVCEVPAGKALFFPLTNAVAWATEPEETEEEIRDIVNESTDAITILECSVDGVPLQDLFSYRAQSPAFVLPVTEGSLANTVVDVGEYFPAVADGYWVLLAPLSKGPHVIEFRGGAGDPDAPDWEVSVTYFLTVVGGGK